MLVGMLGPSTSPVTLWNALKACIAKQTKRFDFPEKDVWSKAWVHGLDQLVRVAGLSPDLDAEILANALFETNWSIVKDWKEAARYDPNIAPARAADMYSAVTARRSGVLAWVKKRW